MEADLNKNHGSIDLKDKHTKIQIIIPAISDL